MRIAFLTHEPFYPPSGGGSAEAVYLIQEFVRRGHEIHLFCPEINNSEAVAREFGVALHQFTTWQMGRYTPLRNFKYLAYPFFLQRLVERISQTVRFDLILSQHAISAVTAGRLRRKMGLPTVMNFLDYLTGFMETWPPYVAPRGFIRALERYELSIPLKYQADGVMTVSDTLADYFAEAGYPRAQLKPIYYGFDSELFAPPDREVMLRRHKQPVVVMHGSFDQHHLGPIALGALGYVAKTRPNTIFRFVGKRTASLNRFLTQVEQKFPVLKCECTGFIPYTEVAKQLAGGSIGIVPYEESTGVHCAFVAKTVEYLAVGLPVVSTPLKSAQRYYKGEPMIRFAGFNGPGFGEKIVSWLDTPPDQYLKAALEASRRVKTELDWRAICRNAVGFVEGVRAAGGPLSRQR
jgi:glycosyltransferase involved in cell wall biosynthesis